MLSTLAGASPQGPPPCRDLVVCAVEVTGLPAVLRSSGDYQIGIFEEPAIPLPSAGVALLSLAEPSLVELRGAAYHGSIYINPADCGTDKVHTLAAAAKPAELEFLTGAVPLADVAVDCVSGCDVRLRAAEQFPDLPLPEGSTEFMVELEFKASGYRAQTVEYRLVPGRNRVKVTLQAVL